MSPNTPAPTRAESRLETIRTCMIETGMYIGDPKLLANVQWVSMGTGRQLRRMDYPNEPAVLCAAAMIAADDYYLTADGGWPDRVPGTPNIANAKATCIGTVAMSAPFRGDWETTRENLARLHELVSTTSNDGNGDAFYREMAHGTRLDIQLEHVLFKLRKQRQEVGIDYPSIGEWPVHSLTAREALDELNRTHYASPLIVYDFNGGRVAPDAYRGHLQCALAQIQFTLEQGECEGGVCEAHVKAIRVLRPPTLRGQRRQYTWTRWRMGPASVPEMDQI
ncbi:hypothetical protein BD769DRAFT_1382912 [Suillus cothurnatus]|nr:hypothetical protein BD769DRAFT_1382912 [Suillus cothurnatus]